MAFDFKALDEIAQLISWIPENELGIRAGGAYKRVARRKALQLLAEGVQLFRLVGDDAVGAVWVTCGRFWVTGVYRP